MFNLNTTISYPTLTFLSTMGKKSFRNIGNLIKRSGDTVKRMLCPTSTSFSTMQKIAQSVFDNKKSLFVGIDDTLIKKMHSKMMQGAGFFYDTKIGRRIMAFRLVIGIVTDGKAAVPLQCSYLFTKELLDSIANHQFPSKDDIAQSIVTTAQNVFPDKKLTVVVDGLYSSINFIKWCKDRKIRLEARMHSHRVVEYKGQRVKIKELLKFKKVRPKGRQMARTIGVIWHKMELQLTIERRFDKNGHESIVFLIATYKAEPREHVANYKKRWPIEKLIRTTKQFLGLQECFSRDLEIQHKHVAAVLLAYALTQVEMQKSRVKTPEAAIRRFKEKNANFLKARFVRFLEDNPYIHS